jgi:hypothetical protein
MPPSSPPVIRTPRPRSAASVSPSASASPRARVAAPPADPSLPLTPCRGVRRAPRPTRKDIS